MQVVWNNKSKNNLKEGLGMDTKELVEYFSKDLFIPNLKAKNKKQSLSEMAELFVSTKLVRSKEIVLEMLNKRETLGSTGVGKGVAIPHGRTTAAVDVKIAFGKTEKGIEYDSIDKKPVHLIFAVLAPPYDEHNRYLPILGKLVEFLNVNKNRKKLLAVETYEDFVEVFNGAD